MLWGAIIGDIVGSIYEFSNIKAKQLWDLYKYKKQYTAKYISYTNHNNQQGIQLTITHI